MAQAIRIRLIAICLCLFTLSFGLAQAQAGLPIAVGQNAPGVLTSEVSGTEYTVTSSGSESVTIQVLALSGGLIPRFQVYNPAGVAILDQGNVSGSSTLTSTVSFTIPGVYTIAIQGENGSTGQYVLSLQPGTPPPPAVDLPRNQPVSSGVGGNTPLRVYRFSTTFADSSLTLTLLSQISGAGMLISLFDDDAGKTLATSDSSLGGVAYRLLAADRRYRIEVRAGGAPGDTTFSICLGTCADGLFSSANSQPSAPNNNVPPTPFPATPIPQAAACTISSTAGGAVNVRSGNGTGYLIVGSLPLGTAAQVIGQNDTGGNAWFRINLNGLVGWVSASVIRTDGDCSAIPFASAPANAPLAPTAVPTQPPQNNPQPPQHTEEPSGDDNDNNNPPADTLPDLEVTITQLNRPGGDDSPTVMLRFTVHNRGDGSAPPAFVETCIDGSCFSNGFTGTLAPGASGSGSVTYNLPQKPLINGLAQFYNITITVDADNQIQEFSESNNDYQSQIR